MRGRPPTQAAIAALAGTFVVLVALLLAGYVIAQEPPPEDEQQPGPGQVPYNPMLAPAQRAALAENLSGKAAAWHVERLARYHRPAPSVGLDRAMRYIARELRAAGLDPVETTYKSDGKATWWVEPAPPAWTCDAAELWIQKPERRQLADWSTDPIRVARFSTSCDVTADVVEVTGQEARLDVKGKIVLVQRDAQALREMAFEEGALGLLLTPEDVPESSELRGAVHASTLSPALDDWETNRFAFNISATEAAIIRASLNTGKRVRVKALIKNARTAPSSCPIVSASISPASPTQRERVVLVAEVAGPKPGANGLSGAAALLGVAKAYKALTDARVLRLPERGIEFLFVPDVHGACAYLAQHRERLDEIVAVIHLGVVGTDTERGPGKGRELHIADGGWLLPNCLPYLVLDFGRYVAQSGLVDVAGSGAPLSLRVHSRGPVAPHSVFYSGPAARPAVSISFFPDASTATSIDTPERLDPTALRRVMYMATGTAYVLAATPLDDRMRFKPLIGPYVERDTLGCLEAIALLVPEVPKERVAWAHHRYGKLMDRNLTRLERTIESLDVFLPPHPDEPPGDYGARAREIYGQGAVMIDERFYALPRGAEVEAKIKELQKEEARLRRETPHLLWRGPVTEDLLRRRAPAALPVPEAIDVPVLFGVMDGVRPLFNVWSEHEAMKWIGLPFPAPPKKILLVPPGAGLDETIAFLRRCEKAGIIRIEALKIPKREEKE